MRNFADNPTEGRWRTAWSRNWRAFCQVRQIIVAQIIHDVLTHTFAPASRSVSAPRRADQRLLRLGGPAC